MLVQVNGKKFFVSDTEEYGLSVTYICPKTEREYVMISKGSDKWTASQLVARLEAYADMPSQELRYLAKEVI